ncbi:hypothetical protein [Sphingomonas adhaesiva]|uniref:hypothetical protein n=1 Tax=Sphingomonas adhaesiva TaxID=28212 RepID=UPI002FF51D51
MVEESPGLEVGFWIDVGDTFAVLGRVEDTMERTQQSVTRDANLMRQATNGMVDLKGSAAEFTAFGNAAERGTQAARQEINRLERESERLTSRLERSAQVFGMTTSEIRRMDAAAKATRLDDLGLTELAGRLRMASVEMERLELSSRDVAVTGRRTGFALQQVALQAPDIVQGC